MMKISILILIIMALNNRIKCSPPVCASSYDKFNRTREIVNCNMPEWNAYIQLQCKFIDNFHLSPSVSYTSIKIDLSLFNLNLTEATFKWDTLKNMTKHSRAFYDTNLEHTSLANNIQVNLTYDKIMNTSSGSIIIYDVFEDKVYRVCPVFDLIKNYSVCCEVENKNDDEDLKGLNFYMALIVIGLLIIIYAIVIITFWQYPPSSFDSIDEMLTKLPSNQVKALKQLVIDTESEQDEVFEDSKCDGVDNLALNIDELDHNYDTYGVNDHIFLDKQDECLNTQDIYVEINRPRLSQRRSLKKSRKRSTLSDIGRSIDRKDLAVRIFKEEKRRASILNNPYKKPYALNNRSTDDSDN